MANVLYGGTEEFDALVYGRHTPDTIQYLQSQAVGVRDRLLDGAKQWVDNSHAMFRAVDFDAVARRARAVVRMVGNIWNPDKGIYTLSTIGDLQGANVDMQRFIMAEPSLRSTYLDKRLEGYAESYRNIHGSHIGERHYDYRRVMTGVVVDELNDKDEVVGWSATTYGETLLPNDEELSLSEQADILHAWTFAKSFVSLKEDDPTSRFNASLI